MRHAPTTVLAGLLALAFVPLSSSAQSGVPTWTSDVAPIVADKCMNCHRPGQIGPMSLLTYEDVTAWTASIGMMVEERIMPPWHADPAYGHFGNDRRLSDEQVETVVAWVEGGTPRGAGEFEPPDFADATDGFLLTGACWVLPTTSSGWRKASRCRPAGPI